MKWRLFAGLVLLSLIAFLAGGCTLGIKTPTDLAKKPKLSVDETKARDVIEDFLSGTAESVRPLKPGELSAVGYIDWDDEAGSEVYCYYKNTGQHTVGLLLLKKIEGTWQLAENVELPGEDIAYAKFVDLNADDIQDLIIGTEAREGAYNLINAFLSKQGSYENVWQEAYTEFVIDNLDNQGQKELLVLKYDRGIESKIACYRYQDEGVVLIDEMELDKYISGYYSVMAAQVTKDRRALFLDFSLGSKSASNLIILEDDALLPLIDPLEHAQDYSLTLKHYSIKSRDVDMDGLMEVPTEYYFKTLGRPASSTSDIYLWRELVEEGRGLEFRDKALSYINPSYNYEFLFPAKWVAAADSEKLMVIKSRQGHTRDFISFYMLSEEGRMSLLFTIESFDDEAYEKWQKNDYNKRYDVMVLATYVDRRVVAYYPEGLDRVALDDRQDFRELMLSKKHIESQFRQLN